MIPASTNLIHYAVTFTLLKLKASTCVGHHLPLRRRHYTTTVLFGLVCCYRCRLFTGISREQSTYTTARYTHQNCVRVVPPVDGEVMSETCRGFEF
jgi:hypothetical protein